MQPAKIDILYELEQKIIEILLVNGSETEDFTETFLAEDETGNLVEVKETNAYKIYEKIYLALQEDEIELSNPIFKTIYTDIINYYNQNIEFEIDKYISQTSPEIANKITSILMLEERDILHKWESRKIVVEKKNVNLAQNVTETILSYRWYLLNKVIEENKNNITADVTADNTEILTTIKDYLSLTTVIAKSLGRVMARF